MIEGDKSSMFVTNLIKKNGYVELLNKDTIVSEKFCLSIIHRCAL